MRTRWEPSSNWLQQLQAVHCAQSIYMFHAFLRVNSDYFAKQH
jgi:hypothetical protein